MELYTFPLLQREDTRKTQVATYLQTLLSEGFVIPPNHAECQKCIPPSAFDVDLDL